MRTKPESVSRATLAKWLRSHDAAPGAEVARVRLEYSEVEGTMRLLRGLVGLPSIRPRVLITAQVSGRWSTAEPPLGELPTDVRAEIIVPAAGTWNLAFDLQAVEARLASAFASERRDTDVFEAGGDLHLQTARDMFPGETIWEGDPRRHLAKTTRYNLQYAWDWRGIADAKDLSVFGGLQAAYAFAKRYEEARPFLTAAKNMVFERCARESLARSAFGRPRHLTGSIREKGKDGWSHMIQATVVGMMARLRLRILALDPGARLVLDLHDGVVIAFPDEAPAEKILPAAQAIVAEPWTLWGKRVVAPATWEVNHGTRGR